MRSMIRIKRTFNLILTLAAMLTMAQTAWAKTETRTATFYLNGGTSGSTTQQDDWTLVSGGIRLHYNNNATSSNKILLFPDNNQTTLGSSILGCNGFFEFPNLEGTVKSVAFTNFILAYAGVQMYVGLNKNNYSTLLHLAGNSTDYDFSGDSDFSLHSATFEGSQVVSASNPLKIMFSGTSEAVGYFTFVSGTIVITYDVEVEDTTDPGHTFTFAANASSDAIIATCTEGSAYHICGLTNRQVTMPLVANDASYDNYWHSASLDQTDFNNAGITDIGAILSYKDKSTNETLDNPPSAIGNYTVTANVTVTYKETAHPFTLSKDFSILAGYKVNNVYSQFKPSKISALEGEAMSITYTQLMDEILEGLTLTGATSGDNITYTQSGNTYTFNMPAEDVNLNATITYPLNEDNITQSGDTYTIKTADGWDYFCRRLEVDGELNCFSGKTVVLAGNITVTTMAGSTDHPFKGTFDGDGHTLTFNYTADRTNCAPFRITDGATIRNLHATGQIEGGAQHYLSGLVGSASGNLTIENCRVSTQISSTVSGIANNGGFVGLLSSHYNQCHITGCVFDGLIYNSNTWNQTYGCGGFVGGFSQYGYAILEDCLFIEGQYDNNGGKHELLWGYDNNKNSTFFHRTNNQGEGKLTNCFYVGTHFLKQGSPAVESADAPDNFAHFGTPTDHCFMQTYGHMIVFDGKYYTPTYGDLVETYDYSGVKSYNIEYDDAPLGIPDITSPLWTESLRYNRSFTAGKPVTIMLPFDFKRDRTTLAGSNENPSGKFYEFKGIHLDVNESNKWVAVMKEVGSDDANEVTTLQANHPYLYVPGESTEHWAMYVSGGFSIFTEGNEGGNKVTPYDGTADFAWNKWNFIGTYQPRYWSETEHFDEVGKVYGFAGVEKVVDGKLVEAGEFVRAKIGAKIRPTSCYLMWAGSEPETTDSNGAKASGMSGTASVMNELPQTITVRLVDANGETTGIGEIDTKTGEVTFDSEAWYTIDGIRLDGKPAKSGMYINNGKKVVVE